MKIDPNHVHRAPFRLILHQNRSHKVWAASGMPPGLQNPPKNKKSKKTKTSRNSLIIPLQLQDSNFGCVGGGDWEAPVWGWSCTRTARPPPARPAPRTVCVPHRETVCVPHRQYPIPKTQYPIPNTRSQVQVQVQDKGERAGSGTLAPPFWDKIGLKWVQN